MILIPIFDSLGVFFLEHLMISLLITKGEEAFSYI